MDLENWLTRLPKIELHAHINGSISLCTMRKLLRSRGREEEANNLQFQKGQITTLDQCFAMFKMIHTVCDTAESIYIITKDVIREFAEDNVKYLELRSTPREVTATGLTKEEYISCIFRAIADSENENLDIVVKFLISIDRRNGVEEAKNTLELAKKFLSQTNSPLVGIDLSGDPTVGNAADYIPVFQEARKLGLKLALHLAEVPACQETIEVLKINPDRIGHGTCLLPDLGGREDLVKYVLDQKIPLELCLTSNVVGQTVPGFDQHHFKFWFDQGHPCVICTDDKGVFNTALSEEYRIAASTFELDKETLWKLSRDSISCIFADENLKTRLRNKWDAIKPKLFDA